MIRRILLALALLLLCGCTVGGVDLEQEAATGLAAELLDGHTYGQTFQLQYPGLHRIDLYTATYARENTHPVIFRIQVSPPNEKDQGEGPDLVHLVIPADQISNSGPTIITFPPIPDTAGQRLYFSIESPGSVPGDAITVYRNEKDVYPDGQMVVDGQPTDGDLAFIAYTQETFTARDIWNDFYSRASQDKPFFVFYGSLVVMLLLVLLITFFWPSRKPKINQENGKKLDSEPLSDPMAENEE